MERYDATIWFCKCARFFKLAAEIQEENGEAAYKDWVQTHIIAPVSGSVDLNEVLEFITNNYKKPYFKIDDFLPPLYTVLVSMPAWHMQDMELLPEPVSHQIKERLMLDWAEDPGKPINAHTFISYFDKLLNAKTRRAAQAKVLKTIQELAQDDNTIDEALIQLWALLNNSNSFTDNFLNNFTKHLGIEFYSRWQNYKWTDLNRVGEPKRQLLEKNKLTIFDIAAYFNYRQNTFTYKEFEPFLNKADDRAREYMRCFVYCAGGKPLFILDEHMQPIGLDYQNIPWPPQFGPLSIHRLKQDKEKWLQLLHDFQIVPA